MARQSNAPRFDATLMDAPSVLRAQRLMSTLQTGNADLFRGALDVLDWCVRQVQEGRRIASVDPAKNPDGIREFSSPFLEAARNDETDMPWAPRALHAEAFDRVVQLVENPPAPTQALLAELESRVAHLTEQLGDAEQARESRAALRRSQWTGELSTLQSQTDQPAPASATARLSAVANASALAVGLQRAARSRRK
ncbi:MAG: hypothetical protein IT353_18880 [Gemmatimonadaceae bacterium]|nr:hypothetical protein [Gemmatimonadaceae bacterium]